MVELKDQNFSSWSLELPFWIWQMDCLGLHKWTGRSEYFMVKIYSTIMLNALEKQSWYWQWPDSLWGKVLLQGFSTCHMSSNMKKNVLYQCVLSNVITDVLITWNWHFCELLNSCSQHHPVAVNFMCCTLCDKYFPSAFPFHLMVPCSCLLRKGKWVLWITFSGSFFTIGRSGTASYYWIWYFLLQYTVFSCF